MNPEAAAMRMADGACEGVGRIRGRIARQREQALDHVLHLLLGGVAVADDRLLDLERGVLRYRQAGEHRGADGGAARLTERERRLRVRVDEYLLDRDLARPVSSDDFLQPLEDRLQARGEVAGTGLDAAARHVKEPGIAEIDDTESRRLQPGIDAENSQLSTIGQSTTAVV